jgi:DNA repair photolyase
VFAEIGNAANITTKGTLIVRDIDVLQELTTNAGCSINISLITLEPSIWQALEPGTPPPMQRLRALERLSAAGISCGIALAPVLPRLTDTRSNLEAVVRAAVDHGAAWIWSGTLHLEPAVRDWLLAALHQHFPAVTPAYVRVYGAPGHEGGARYTPQRYTEALDHRIAEIKQRYGLLECPKNPPRLGQYTDASAALASTQPPLQQVELPLPRSALAPR